MLYILCGIPFSGKSTLAREIAKLRGYTHIDLDEVKFQLMSPNITDSLISEKDWDRIYNEIYSRINSSLAKNQTVIYDTGNFTHDERRIVSRFAAKHNTNFKTIFVDIPIALAHQRLTLNRKQQVRFNLTDQEFASAVQEMEPPSSVENVLVYDGTKPLQEWLKTHNI